MDTQKPEDLGFGIALDLDVDKMIKNTKFVTESMKKISKGFDSCKISIDKYAKTLKTVRDFDKIVPTSPLPKQRIKSVSAKTVAHQNMLHGMERPAKQVLGKREKTLDEKMWTTQKSSLKALNKISKSIEEGNDMLPALVGALSAITRVLSNIQQVPIHVEAGKPIAAEPVHTKQRRVSESKLKSMDKAPFLDAMNKKTKEATTLAFSMGVAYAKSAKLIGSSFDAIKTKVSEVGDAFGNIISEIQNAKYKLLGFGLIIGDLLHLQLAFTRLSVSANVGDISVGKLAGTAKGLALSMGQSIETVRDAMQAMGDYGHSIVTAGGITSQFSRGTIKNALKMKEAWGIPLEESISMFDELNRTMKMSTETSQKRFVNSLKTISKATGVSVRELGHMTKELQKMNQAFGLRLNADQLIGANEFLAKLQQAEGDVGALKQSFKDLRDFDTWKNVAGGISILGGNLDKVRSLNMPDYFKEMGRLASEYMKKHDMMSKDSQMVQEKILRGGGFEMEQVRAMGKAYDSKLLAKSKSGNLDQDYAKVMATGVKQMEIAWNKFRLTMLDISEKTLPALTTAIVKLNESMTKISNWVSGLDSSTVKIAAFTLAGAALSGVLVAVGKAAKYLIVDIAWSSILTISKSVGVLSGAFTLVAEGLGLTVGALLGWVVGIGLAIYAIYKYRKEIWKFIKDGYKVTKEYISKIGRDDEEFRKQNLNRWKDRANAVKGFFSEVYSGAGTMWDSLMNPPKGSPNFLKPIMEGMGAMWLDPKSALMKGLSWVKSKLVSTFSGGFEEILRKSAAFNNSIIDFLLTPFTELGRIFNKISEIFQSLLSGNFKTASKQAGEILTEGVTGTIYKRIQDLNSFVGAKTQVEEKKFEYRKPDVQKHINEGTATKLELEAAKKWNLKAHPRLSIPDTDTGSDTTSAITEVGVTQAKKLDTINASLRDLITILQSTNPLLGLKTGQPAKTNLTDRFGFRDLNLLNNAVPRQIGG